ncbi:hypothetical protein GCM10023196_003220 [Actinoallomurus vinaceus]|uniref:Uncharacterized protein n=1 Tax=Actinoallomurus vinaceus TaxID=1080074 RepID=A0ABP8U2N2_9ACTN
MTPTLLSHHTPTLLSHHTPLSAVASALPRIDSPVRLRLDPVLSGRGPLNGAWWPYSHDAAAELPGLIAAVDQRLGRTTLRVCVHTDAWNQIPGRIPARGRQIEVGRRRGTDPRLITLMFAGADAVNLLIMPSDSTGGPAKAAPGVAGIVDLRPVDSLTTIADHPLSQTLARRNLVGRPVLRTAQRTAATATGPTAS